MTAKGKEVTQSLIRLWEDALDEIATMSDEDLLKLLEGESFEVSDLAAMTRDVFLNTTRSVEGLIDKTKEPDTTVYSASSNEHTDLSAKFELMTDNKISVASSDSISLSNDEVQEHLRGLLKLGILRLS